MPKFEEVVEAADYFQRVRIKEWQEGTPREEAGVGAECILTEGPKDKKGNKYDLVRTEFRKKHIRVSVTGEYGNRLVKVRRFDGSRKRNNLRKEVWKVPKHVPVETPLQRHTKILLGHIEAK